jgi:hypothetical protein
VTISRPVRASSRAPRAEDLMPKLGYCWWWSPTREAWFLCDARWLGDLYPWWLPYTALPDPSSLSDGCSGYRLRPVDWKAGDPEWVWDGSDDCWVPCDKGVLAVYCLSSFGEIDLRGS